MDFLEPPLKNNVLKKKLTNNQYESEGGKGIYVSFAYVKNVSLKSNMFSEVYLTANKEQCDTV